MNVPADLEYIRKHVTVWPEKQEHVFLDEDGEIRFSPSALDDFYPQDSQDPSPYYLPESGMEDTCCGGKRYSKEEWLGQSMVKTITETKYGILNLNTEQLVTYYTSSNDGDFCTDTQYILSKNDDNVWLVGSEEIAQKALDTDTEWYNAGHNTPTHGYLISPKTHCVVKVEITSVISKV